MTDDNTKPRIRAQRGNSQPAQREGEGAARAEGVCERHLVIVRLTAGLPPQEALTSQPQEQKGPVKAHLPEQYNRNCCAQGLGS